MKNKNVIHRDTIRVCMESLIDWYDGFSHEPIIKKGDTILAEKDGEMWYEHVGRTGKTYKTFISHIRNADINRIIWQVNY